MTVEITPFQELERFYDNISSKTGYRPKQFIVSESFFRKWFYWCKDNSYDFRHFRGIPIILFKKQLPDISCKL